MPKTNQRNYRSKTLMHAFYETIRSATQTFNKSESMSGIESLDTIIISCPLSFPTTKFENVDNNLQIEQYTCDSEMFQSNEPTISHFALNDLMKTLNLFVTNTLLIGTCTLIQTPQNYNLNKLVPKANTIILE